MVRRRSATRRFSVVRGASAAAVSASILLAAAPAWADKVALLAVAAAPGSSADAAADARALSETRAAVGLKAHQLAGDDDMAKAKGAVADGVPDTSSEYLAAGKAAQADWTLVGRVEARSGTQSGVRYRLELVACLVASGRVESVARDVYGENQNEQVAEMIGVLLRKEGLGTEEIRWKVQAKEGTAPEPPKEPEKPAPPPPPKGPPPVRHPYAEHAPIVFGAGVGLWAAVARPGNARGSSVSSTIELHGGYALPQLPGLELRANAGISYLGPSALHVDGGARYALPLAPTVRLYAGPELTLGVFAPTGADQTPRFLARGALFLALGLGEHVQIDALGEFFAAPGGSGALLLTGGSARGSVRF